MNETEQRTQNGSKNDYENKVRNVWWNKDPSDSPQGWECDEQCSRKFDCPLSAMPHESSYADRYVGERKSQAVNLQDMRGDISAEKNQKGNDMREAGMQKRKRAQISRVAVGVKSRVDRLKAIGNGQVPAVVALAWCTLMDRIK